MLEPIHTRDGTTMVDGTPGGAERVRIAWRVLKTVKWPWNTSDALSTISRAIFTFVAQNRPAVARSSEAE
ncbi:hypothetical protein OAO87_02065 [bacterium]|nr:hypothetical protein [bacterium]